MPRLNLRLPYPYPGLKGIGRYFVNNRAFKKRKFRFFGAGCNIKEAKKPYFITEDIAIFGYCEFWKTLYLKTN